MTAPPNAQQGATPPLARSDATMLHGWLLRAELQKLFPSYLQRGGDPYQWGYCAAIVFDAIRPGRDRIVTMPSGHSYGGRYYRTWGRCTPQNLLCEGSNRVAMSLDEVPDVILRAIERACEAAGKRRHHKFHKGKTIGRLLGVTQAERERLGLRLIGAADATTSKLKGTAMDRKREKDRIRAETKRREAGAKSRKESIAEKARELGISPGAYRVRLHRERLKESSACNGFVAKNEGAVCNGFVAPIETAKASEETMDCGANSAHVTVSSHHKYREPISSVAHDQLSFELGPAKEAGETTVLGALGSAPPEAPEVEPSERVEIGKRVEAELGERRGRPKENPANCPEIERGKETRDLAAERAGFDSAKSYERAKTVVEKGAPELVGAAGRVSAPPPVTANPPASRRYQIPPNPRGCADLPPLFAELGAQLAHLVHCRAHEAAKDMLRARDPGASTSDNMLVMVKVWHDRRSALRRELHRQGVSFVGLHLASATFAQITERETAEASPCATPLAPGLNATPEIMDLAPQPTGEAYVG